VHFGFQGTCLQPLAPQLELPNPKALFLLVSLSVPLTRWTILELEKLKTVWDSRKCQDNATLSTENTICYFKFCSDDHHIPALSTQCTNWFSFFSLRDHHVLNGILSDTIRMPPLYTTLFSITLYMPVYTTEFIETPWKWLKVVSISFMGSLFTTWKLKRVLSITKTGNGGRIIPWKGMRRYE